MTETIAEAVDSLAAPEAPRPRRRRLLRAVVVLAVFGMLIAGLAGLLFVRQVNPPGAAGPEVSVTIAHGTSAARIAALLDEHGVIDNATAFRLYLRLKGGA